MSALLTIWGDAKSKDELSGNKRKTRYTTKK